MDYLTLSCVIAAKEPETEPREEPCFVQQQQDTEDTVPCSGDQALFNELLRLMGFDIPYPEQSEDYSTQIKIKPKNSYTDLNISFSGNVSIDQEKWEESEGSRTVSISSSDYVESESGGYVDLAGKLNLVETDKIKFASWSGTVYDAALSPILPKPIISLSSIRADHRLPLPQAVNAELLVTLVETSQIFEIKIYPREGAAENAYQSSVIIQPEGCGGGPSRYELKIPECYQNRLYDDVGWPGDDGDVEIIDPPPEFVEPSDVDKKWCVCGNHESTSERGLCYPGVKCSDIGEPDCVPDDREEGDDYC